MYLTLGKDNPVVKWIKEELIKDGNRKVSEIYKLLPSEFTVTERTFAQYTSYVKTCLLEKSVIYREKVEVK